MYVHDLFQVNFWVWFEARVEVHFSPRGCLMVLAPFAEKALHTELPWPFVESQCPMYVRSVFASLLFSVLTSLHTVWFLGLPTRSGVSPEAGPAGECLLGLYYGPFLMSQVTCLCIIESFKMISSCQVKPVCVYVSHSSCSRALQLFSPLLLPPALTPKAL